MPKRPSMAKKAKRRAGTPHDFTVTARRVVEQAIGEKLDGSPLDNPDAGKNPAAVALGKLGGSKAGKRAPPSCRLDAGSRSRKKPPTRGGRSAQTTLNRRLRCAASMLVVCRPIEVMVNPKTSASRSSVCQSSCLATSVFVCRIPLNRQIPSRTPARSRLRDLPALLCAPAWTIQYRVFGSSNR